MQNTDFEIVKSTGEKVKFSLNKLIASLKKSGATEEVIGAIVEKIKEELYQGISTREIYDRAYVLLKKAKSTYASKYKLKKAIYELGPTGFPFERFVAQILNFSGYATKVGETINGKCVKHEVDVIATKNNSTLVVECKYHGDHTKKCNVKVPLYIHSRYEDIREVWNNRVEVAPLDTGWVVTNTRFTTDAIEFGICAGLYLLSWDYPKDDALKDRIDRLGLYPITVSDLLSKREKEFLLSRDVVLLRQLKKDTFYLDHLGLSESRKERILKSINQLCP